MPQSPPSRSDTDVIGKRVVAQVIDLILMIVIFIAAFFVITFTGGFISGLTGGDGTITSVFS